MVQSINLANDLLEQQYLGTGLLSPLRTDPDTLDFQTVSGEENVLKCIEDLLMTRIGERLMNEDFGSAFPSALFENKAGLLHVLPTLTVQTILRFETRVINVTAVAESAGATAIEVTVSWTVKATGSPGSLVYPYYLSPPAGGVQGT